MYGWVGINDFVERVLHRPLRFRCESACESSRASVEIKTNGHGCALAFHDAFPAAIGTPDRLCTRVNRRSQRERSENSCSARGGHTKHFISNRRGSAGTDPLILVSKRRMFEQASLREPR